MKIKQYITLDDKKAIFQDYLCINNIQDFLAWYNKVVNDGSIYRGVSEAKFKNYTSAQRFNIINDYEDLPHQTQIKLQIEELRKFNNGLIERYCRNLGIPCTDLYLLSLAQHYGGISPLLDFTTDINTALFFMCDGTSFSKGGDGEDRCNAISNYSSIYYYSNAEICRTPQLMEDYEQGQLDEKNIYKVINISSVISYLMGKTSFSDLLSYQRLSNLVITPYAMPLLVEHIMVPNDNQNEKVQLIISNLNIESQKGCFIYHDHYCCPLEYGLACIDIHKSIVPFIEQNILKEKGINKKSIYPEERLIVNEALYKSLARDDYMQYYHW